MGVEQEWWTGRGIREGVGQVGDTGKDVGHVWNICRLVERLVIIIDEARM